LEFNEPEWETDKDTYSLLLRLTTERNEPEIVDTSLGCSPKTRRKRKQPSLSDMEDFIRATGASHDAAWKPEDHECEIVRLNAGMRHAPRNVLRSRRLKEVIVAKKAEYEVEHQRGQQSNASNAKLQSFGPVTLDCTIGQSLDLALVWSGIRITKKWISNAVALAAEIVAAIASGGQSAWAGPWFRKLWSKMSPWFQRMIPVSKRWRYQVVPYMAIKKKITEEKVYRKDICKMLPPWCPCWVVVTAALVIAVVAFALYIRYCSPLSIFFGCYNCCKSCCRRCGKGPAPDNEVVATKRTCCCFGQDEKAAIEETPPYAAPYECLPGADPETAEPGRLPVEPEA